MLDRGAIPAVDLPPAVGLFLLAWTVVTFHMRIGSFRLSGALASVFTALLVTLILLTIGNWGSDMTLVKLGGRIGIVTAVLARYTAAAAS